MGLSVIVRREEYACTCALSPHDRRPPGAAAHCSPLARPGRRRATRPTVVAHRGASAYAPENTLAAVDRAAALGIAWVENDVQRTRDGELVVLHDDSLQRTTDVEEVSPAGRRGR
ncbi:hypothetical protein SGLAM104S_00524 [Streptomyces glaucescens]